MASRSVRAAWDKVSKRIMLLIYLAMAVPWRRWWKLRDPGADVVLWIHHRAPSSRLRYLLREDTVVKDLGLVAALCARGIRFRTVWGTAIDDVRDSVVVYTVHPYNPRGLTDYAAGLLAELRSAEGRGNRLFPSASEAEWWENKVFMHRRFDELGIHCPATRIVELASGVPTELELPTLAKEPHASGSRGLHLLHDRAEAEELFATLQREGETHLLIQQLIDMRRDFRATLVGDEIVHSYFRINQAAEWKPTSTSHGSIVDFAGFPEKWRNDIVEVFGRLGLHSGAFDICWDHDDLDSEPYFLEVSPSYTPNPPPPAGWDRPYYEFKKQLVGKDAYGRASVATVFDIARRLVDCYGIGA